MNILLGTQTGETDGLAQLSHSDPTYFTVKHTWTNPSTSTAIYRIMNGHPTIATKRWVRSGEITVGAKKQITVTTTGLRPQNVYYFFLERKEYGTWVTQTSTKPGIHYDTVYTSRMHPISAATSPDRVAITWPFAYKNADYRVDIYDKTPGDGVEPVQTVANDKIKHVAKTASYIAIASQLDPDKKYHGIVYAKELVEGGGSSEYGKVKSVEFETSDRANLTADAIFATYVDLSWDYGKDVDEEDSVARFRLSYYSYATKKWKVVMNWTPHSDAQKISATGLLPGEKYFFELSRFTTNGYVFREGGFPVTTKTTELGGTPPTSRRVYMEWDPLYSSAQYAVKYASPGVSMGSITTTKNNLHVKNLVSDKAYSLELFVREKGKEVLVTKTTFHTEKASILSEVSVQDTVATLRVQQFAKTKAAYRIRTADHGIKTPTFHTNGPGTTDVELPKLSPGKAYKLILERAENGTWTIQAWNDMKQDHITIMVPMVTSVTTSVASTSALVKWDQDQSAGGSEYAVQIFDKAPADGVEPLLIYGNDKITVESSGSTSNKHSVLVSGLTKTTSYFGVLLSVGENNTLRKVTDFTFETSALAVFQLVDHYASHANFKWAAGEVGEDDGVAEFRIRYTETEKSGKNPPKYATGWLPHTTDTATVAGLTPGVRYDFSLLRLSVDGKSMATQASITAQMKSSKLHAEGTASTHIEVAWTPIYADAKYRLVYTPAGETPVSRDTAETKALLADLTPGVKHTIELYVIEQGAPVGVQTSALGSAVVIKNTEQRSAPTLLRIGLGLVIAGVVAYLMLRPKKKAVFNP